MAEQNGKNRDIATGIIAAHLGIPVESVEETTPIGDSWVVIQTMVSFETGKSLILQAGATAGDIFRQL